MRPRHLIGLQAALALASTMSEMSISSDLPSGGYRTGQSDDGGTTMVRHAADLNRASRTAIDTGGEVTDTDGAEAGRAKTSGGITNAKLPAFMLAPLPGSIGAPVGA